MLLSSAVFSLLIASAAMAEAPAGLRVPTGPWRVDFGDSACVAERNYGTAEQPLMLVLKAPPIGDVMQIAVLRDARWTPAEPAEARVVIDGASPLKTNLLMFTPKGAKQRVYLLNMPSTDFARVRQAKLLAFRSSGLNEIFALSGMQPLLKVMDDCVADLRRVWNIADATGAEAPALARRASGNVARYFDDDDYPAAAVASLQGGTVKFAMLVGEDGRVADCTIIEPSGAAELDGQACAIVRERAKFEPARGKDGKPAKDAVLTSVRWVIPD
jgi:TonB family protein